MSKIFTSWHAFFLGLCASCFFNVIHGMDDAPMELPDGGIFPIDDISATEYEVLERSIFDPIGSANPTEEKGSVNDEGSGTSTPNLLSSLEGSWNDFDSTAVQIDPHNNTSTERYVPFPGDEVLPLPIRVRSEENRMPVRRVNAREGLARSNNDIPTERVATPGNAVLRQVFQGNCNIS